MDVLQDRHSVKAKLWKNQKCSNPGMRKQDNLSKDRGLGLTPGNLLPLPNVCSSAYILPHTGDLACFLCLPDHKGVHNFSRDCLNIIKLLLSTPFVIIVSLVHDRYSNIKLVSTFSGQFWEDSLESLP